MSSHDCSGLDNNSMERTGDAGPIQAKLYEGAA
jgi:hypothetical protein